MIEGRQKRSKGEGTVSLRKDGRWEARLKDPITGKRRSAYAKTHAEAKRKLREMVGRADRGQPPLSSATKVKDFAADWLSGPGTVGRQESTLREYERRLDSYVLPLIGQKALREVTVIDIEHVLARAVEAGQGRSSAQGIRNAVSALLSHAERARLIPDNPARRARLPETPTRKVEPPATMAEVDRLLTESAGTEIGELVQLIVFTGCRVGEALAARWEDIDLDQGKWVVCRTTAQDRAGTVVVKPRTKTGEPRTIPLNEHAVTSLQRQRKRVAELRLAAGALWSDLDLVFPSTVGTPQDSRNLRKDLKVVAERAGYRHSFHQLRHVFATVTSSGVPLQSLSKILGHARLSTTADVYSHLYEPDARRATDAVGEVFGRSVSNRAEPASN